MRLHAGRLSAEIVEGDIRGVRVRGVEVVQRVYATVRDDGWRTAETVVRRTVAEDDGRAFDVRIEAESVLGGRIVVVWRLHAIGTALGTLDAELEWRATESFPCNRIGLCVHHPTGTWAGAAWSTRLAGARGAGRLDSSVMPQPVVGGRYRPAVGPFETLRLDRGAAWTSLLSPDDLLELEDQRNWGDASYKSYASPIPPAPRSITKGETGRARVRLAAGVDARPKARAAPRLRDAGAVFPPVGLDVGEGTPGLCPHHLRFVVDASAPDAPALIASAARRAAEAACGLVVALIGTRPSDGVIAALRSAAPLRVVHLTPTRAPATREAMRVLRRSIGPIPLGAGTLGSFSELNRCRDDLHDAGSLSWSLDPQVHATDARSIMENVPAVRDQLATAAAIVPGAERHIALDLGHGSTDARRGTSFEAAWMVGVLAHAAGGAASFVVRPPGGTTTDVVERAIAWEGAPAVVVDDPRGRTAGVGIRTPAGVELLLANLTPGRVGVAAAGRRLVLSPYEVRSVTASA